MQHADILIQNGLVVTVDSNDTILEDGAVAISGREIAAVGPTVEVTARFSADQVIDASGQVVMPGLINAHVHAPDSLFRSLVGDMPLEPWLERLWIAEKRFVRAETVELGARLAYAEMIAGGITTALDMFWFPERSAEVARQAGFRLVTGPIYFDMEEPDGIPPDERTERARAFLQEYRDDPLIVPCVSPHSAYTVSPQYLEQAAALAAEFGVLLHTHASETAAELASVRERYGAAPPEHFDRLGLLSERTILAHCVHVSDEEIALLAERRAVVAHCPVCNLKLGSGIAPLKKMREAGVRVALGTDGPVSSNDLDLWLAMRFVATLHKGVSHDPTFLDVRDVVRMVTCDAADALGLGDRIGSLEAGKRADLILIDLNSPHLAPLYDVYSHLVYAVGRGDVSTALIDGRPVMLNRQLTTLDQAAILASVRALAPQIQDFLSKNTH
jgi:5-methylthioadenosine/S-adenosylhomocysteine deaminase